MTPLSTPTITIRPAYADDDFALAQLAALDSAQVPARPLLLGEIDAELRVALSVRDGSAIADPFFPTSDVLALLRKHAAATRYIRVSRRRRRHYRLGFQHRYAD
jgi:hypothetical protein